MNESRIKNVGRNIIFSTIQKIYQLIMPFIIRTIFIMALGMEYLGLNGLFSSIIGVLSLAELGFGTALVFNMYKAVAEKDEKTICALMNYYKKCYRYIGTIILIIGIILLPFLNYLVKGDIPSDINIYILYLINLISTVISYFMFAYKNSLLIAHQRSDISSKINIITSTLHYLLQLVILLIFKNYYAYIVLMPIINVLTNIINALVANKLYPNYKAKGELSIKIKRKITEKVKALICVKIGSIVLNSVDNIVISAFLGLNVLAIYNNYYFIISAVVSLVGLLTSSSIATIGNSIVTENIEKNYKDFKRLSSLNFWVVSWCTVCLLCLYQPFMMLWVGDKNIFSMIMVILFSIYFYVLQSNQVLGAYKDAAGIWESDRYRPFIVAIVNLLINLLLVNSIGVYGIILSTVVSLLFINTPWLMHNVTKLVFNKKPYEYLLNWIIATIKTIFVGTVTYYICSLIPNEGILNFIIKVILCIIIPNIIYIILSFKSNDFKENIKFINKIKNSFKVFNKN